MIHRDEQNSYHNSYYNSRKVWNFHRNCQKNFAIPMYSYVSGFIKHHVSFVISCQDASENTIIILLCVEQLYKSKKEQLRIQPQTSLEGLRDVSLTLGSISTPYPPFSTLHGPIVSSVTLHGWQNLLYRSRAISYKFGNGTVHRQRISVVIS